MVDIIGVITEPEFLNVRNVKVEIGFNGVSQTSSFPDLIILREDLIHKLKYFCLKKPGQVISGRSKQSNWTCLKDQIGRSSRNVGATDWSKGSKMEDI